MQDSQSARPARSGGTSAALIGGAVAMLALPSAVLAFSSGKGSGIDALAADVASGAFVPSSIDPRLARSITVRALSKGRLFRFTPAVNPSPYDNSVITVAVRLPANGRGFAVPTGINADAGEAPGGLRIAPTAYSLGAARGYRSFAESSAAGSSAARKLEMPDLGAYSLKSAASGGDPSRFAPRVVLDEREKTGRAPRTFEQSDQSVDLGGSYRVTRNLNVTAGVRYSSDRDRLVPITDGNQDNQAVYVGTQFRF